MTAMRASMCALNASSFLGGHPQLLMFARADDVAVEVLEVHVVHVKLCHVAGEVAALRVPIARDLDCIGQVQHGIEDGLLGQAWRERAHAGVEYLEQLAQADRTIESHSVPHRRIGVSPGVIVWSGSLERLAGPISETSTAR